MTSVLKLRSTALCHGCQRWVLLSKSPKVTTTGGFPTSLQYRLGLRSNSSFTKHHSPPAFFFSSLLNPRSKNQSPLLGYIQKQQLDHLLCTPSLFQTDSLFRTYSVSPQPQQKDEQSNEYKQSSEGNSSGELREGDRKSSDNQVDNADDDAPKGIVARFKDAYKNYGKALIGVHCATSVVWFGSFYYAAYLGIDVIPLLKWMGLSDRFISPFQSGLGDVAVAYLIYKIATPARYTVTILGTRETVKYLRAKGFMEPVPEGARIRDFVKESRVQVREKYEDIKDDIKEKKDEYKDKMDEKKDDFREKMEERKDKFKDKFKK